MSLAHKPITWPDITVDPDHGDPEYNGEEMVPGELDANGDPKWYRYRQPPGTYASIWELRQAAWTQIVRAYEQNPGDFYNSYRYVDSHPIFWTTREGFTGSDLPPNHVIRINDDTGITRGCYLYPVKCNPATQHIEDNEDLNTCTMTWYEFGPIDLLPQDHGGAGTLCATYHDYELDGGSSTYENAIIEIALKIHKKYGNDRVICDKLPVNAIEDLDAAD